MSSAITAVRKRVTVNTNMNSTHGGNSNHISSTIKYMNGNHRRPTSRRREGTRPSTSGSNNRIRRPMSPLQGRPSTSTSTLRKKPSSPKSPTDKSTVTHNSNNSNQTASTKSNTTSSHPNDTSPRSMLHPIDEARARKTKSRGGGFFRRRKNNPKPEPRYDSDISSLDDDCDICESSTASRTDREILQELTEFMNKEFPIANGNTTSLHLACQKHCSDELILNHLLPTSPEAVREVDASNELPLHSAMKDVEGVSERVLGKLLELNPDAVRHVSYGGNMPIHTLLECHPNPPVFVVKQLLEVYPKAVLAQTAQAVPFSTDAQAYITRRTGQMAGEGADDDTVLSDFTTEANTVMCWNAFGLFGSSSGHPHALEGTLCNTEETDETGFTLLHLAVLKGVKPEIVECIIQTDPDCIKLKTSKGRTAKDCAKFKVAKAVQEDEQVTGGIKNTFAAIEMLQVFESNFNKRRKLERRMTKTSLSVKSLRGSKDISSGMPAFVHENEEETQEITKIPSKTQSSSSFDAKQEWRKLGNVVKFMGAFSFAKRSMLGPDVPADADTITVSDNMRLPLNLSYLCVDLELPVGFRRLRRALLSNYSNFMMVEFFQKKLKFKEVQIGSWDKFNDAIGSTENDDGNEKQYLGAERKASYIMPKSGLVAANMAHETICLVEYNDHCFAIKKVTRNPNVPYGSKFEAHVLMVFVNKGDNTCQMTASVEARFFGKPPMIAWKIKNGMYAGVTDFFVALGECIRENVEAEVNNAVASSREMEL